MSTKPLKAYSVQSDEYGCIVFETNSAAARRVGANQLDTEWEYIESCRRAPWADEYAEVKGGVPPLVMVENGWWLECMHCGRQINSDLEAWDENNEAITLEPVECGQHIYCSQSCKDERDSEIAARDLAFETFKKSVQEKRPDLTFTEYQGGGHWISMTAKFTFPGSKFGGTARGEVGSDEISFWIANGDKAAWDTYESSREGETA